MFAYLKVEHMKKYILISMLAALPLVAQEASESSSSAPDAAKAPAAEQGHGRRPQHGDRQAHRARLIQKFDVNKDGKLDEQEKAEMKKFIDAHRQSADGEGRGSAERRHGRRGEGQGRPSREALIKEFDKDQDGKLSDEERAEMHKALQERRKGNKAGEKGDKGPRHRRAPQQPAADTQDQD